MSACAVAPSCLGQCPPVNGSEEAQSQFRTTFSVDSVLREYVTSCQIVISRAIHQYFDIAYSHVDKTPTPRGCYWVSVTRINGTTPLAWIHVLFPLAALR
jgi:hypothetical protein